MPGAGGGSSSWSWTISDPWSHAALDVQGLKPGGVEYLPLWHTCLLSLERHLGIQGFEATTISCSSSALPELSTPLSSHPLQRVLRRSVVGFVLSPGHWMPGRASPRSLTLDSGPSSSAPVCTRASYLWPRICCVTQSYCRHLPTAPNSQVYCPGIPVVPPLGEGPFAVRPYRQLCLSANRLPPPPVWAALSAGESRPPGPYRQISLGAFCTCMGILVSACHRPFSGAL